MPTCRHNLSHAPQSSAVRPNFVRRRRALRWLIGVLAAACLPHPAVAQESVVTEREYNVKAASLYAFGRYVTWPEAAFASPTSPFVIGVLGGNPFGNALDQIAAKKTIAGRPIVVRQLATPAEAAGCHMVFVSRTTTPEAEAELFRLARTRPMLLVGESPGFAARGGVVNFFQSGSYVRFELNADRGAESKLSLDAKMLSLGTKAEIPK